MKVMLETERLMLREFVPADAADLFRLDSDPRVMRYLGGTPLTVVTQAGAIVDRILAQYAQYGIGRWCVIEKTTGEFVGWSGLRMTPETINGHTMFYDLGYRLLHAHWGKGYATETALAAARYAFDVLKVDRLYGMADARNLASQRVLQKAGLSYVEDFTYEGGPHKWFATR